MTDRRRRLYDQHTATSPWWETAFWGLALYGYPNGPDDDPDDEIPPFGGPWRTLWDRLGIKDLTG